MNAEGETTCEGPTPRAPWRCPQCRSTSVRVVDTRCRADHKHRRKSCDDCGHRLNTREQVVDGLDL